MPPKKLTSSRQRTLPFLPPSERPKVIQTAKGAAIQVDQHKVEDKDRILKRGQKIHKRLEREIHPEEVVVRSTSVEETWAIRMLNMLSSLEALLTLGKCREMPVCGFVGDVFVQGVIDEIALKPLDSGKDTPTKAGKRQSTLNAFFGGTAPRTHRLIVIDSKTRASGTMPRMEDTRAGQFQVMLYKELLEGLLHPTPVGDGILPTSTTGGFAKIFEHLGLDPAARFSEGFLTEARAIVVGNGLRWGANEAVCLLHLADCWDRYVQQLGLGVPAEWKDGGDELQLVFRRAGAKKDRSRKRRRKERKRRSRPKPKAEVEASGDDEDAELQKAIQLSLESSEPTPTHLTESQVSAILDPPSATAASQTPEADSQRPDDGGSQSPDAEELDEWALAVECQDVPQPMTSSTVVEVPVLSSQDSPKATKSTFTTPSSSPSKSQRQPESQLEIESEDEGDRKSGTIIGRLKFAHDPAALEKHLAWTLEYWRGEREPQGVSLEQTRRCAWCEFEEGCEWREAKAREVLEAKRRARLEGLKEPPATAP